MNRNDAKKIAEIISNQELQEMFKANALYYGNSQFIHESLPLKEDVYRTLYRITLPLDYPTL